MAWIEKFDSRAEEVSPNDGSLELLGTVTDTPSGIAARFVVYGSTPETLHGLVRMNVSLTPIMWGLWAVKVKYGKIENKIEMQLDLGCDKAKKTTSLETIANYNVYGLTPVTTTLNGAISDSADSLTVAGTTGFPTDAQTAAEPFSVFIDNEEILVGAKTGTAWTDLTRGHNNTQAAAHADAATVTLVKVAPDFGGLVNVSGDKVEGADVYIGSGSLTVSWSSKWLSIRSDYIDTIKEMRPSANDADIWFQYKGQHILFPKNTLLFVGGSLRESSNDGASITLKFEISETEDVIIGERDGTNNTTRALIPKEGWHFIWFRSAPLPSNTAVRVKVATPVSAHVEKFYNLKDFTRLEIFDKINTKEAELQDILDAEAGDDE